MVRPSGQLAPLRHNGDHGVIVEPMRRLGVRHIDIHDHAAEGLARASEARRDRYAVTATNAGSGSPADRSPEVFDEVPGHSLHIPRVKMLERSPAQHL